MAFVVMTYVVMSYVVMAYMVMAYILMAYIMAYILMAYIVMADIKRTDAHARPSTQRDATQCNASTYTHQHTRAHARTRVYGDGHWACAAYLWTTLALVLHFLSPGTSLPAQRTRRRRMAIYSLD